MITGMHHVGISVANLERSIAFYRDLLGLQVIQQVPMRGANYDAIMGLKGTDGRIAVLRTGNFEIELLEFQRPPSRPAQPHHVSDQGISHFAVHVEDIPGLHARLIAAGVRVHSAPVYFASCATTAVYFCDPDGNYIEMIEEKAQAPQPAEAALARR
ncbi:MAG: VOC family protein [Gammaproteobacteria bacterium]|nr:VOC family protein [Gammaproteobacteria bacterium]